jgi:hypothetical protein
VEAGTLTLEHAQVLARVAPTSPARQAALASDHPDLNEAHLVAKASTQSPDEFARTVRRWAATVDAAAMDAEHDAATAREHLTLTRRSDGVALTGFLTHEHGETLALALRAVGGVPAATDTRSRDQRQGAALADTARLVLDRGLAGTGQSVRPHLSVLVSWETLQREVTRAADHDRAAHDRSAHPDADPNAATTWLPQDWPASLVPPAETTGGTLIPRTVLDRLACDSEITRIVFGPTGDVLDLGRAQRTYTGQQRRAIIARDTSCRYPGCGAPVTLGEVHHVIPWACGGHTSISNGILLCWHHHDLIHRQGIRIARDKARGRWTFTRSDGTVIDNGPPTSGAPANETGGSAGRPLVGHEPRPLPERDREPGAPPDTPGGPSGPPQPSDIGEPPASPRHPRAGEVTTQGTLPLSA